MFILCASGCFILNMSCSEQPGLETPYPPPEVATPKLHEAETKTTRSGVQMAWVLESQASAVVLHIPEMQLYINNASRLGGWHLSLL